MSVKSEPIKCKYYSPSSHCSGNGTGLFSKANACHCCRAHCLMQRTKEVLPKCEHMSKFLADEGVKLIDERTWMTNQAGEDFLEKNRIYVNKPPEVRNGYLEDVQKRKSPMKRQRAVEENENKSSGSSVTISLEDVKATINFSEDESNGRKEKIIKIAYNQTPSSSHSTISQISETQAPISSSTIVASLPPNKEEEKEKTCSVEADLQNLMKIHCVKAPTTPFSANAVDSVTSKLKEVNDCMEFVTSMLKWYSSAIDELQPVRKATLQAMEDMFIQKAKVIRSIVNNEPNANTSLKESYDSDKKWCVDVKEWRKSLVSGTKDKQADSRHTRK